MAVFFALITFFGWAIGDIFGTIESRKLGSTLMYFWGLVFSAILTSFLIPFAGGISDWDMFLFASAIIFLDFTATFSYFKALEIGSASLVGALAGSFGFITVLISIVFFHESITSVQFAGVLFAVLGVILSSLNFSELKRTLSKGFSDPSIKFALYALIGWGVYYSLVHIPVRKIGWFWSLYPWSFYFIFLLPLANVRKNALSVLRNKKDVIIISLFILLVWVANFSFNIGVTYGYTAVVAPIASSYPVLFVLLSRIIFKDKLTSQQKLGVISSLMGIVMISLR